MKKEEINKCHICGETDEQNELTLCEQCGKVVCLSSDECGEILNEDQMHCKECLSKQSKYECDNCLQTDCPLDRYYSHCYDCDEYVELSLENIIDNIKDKISGNKAYEQWFEHMLDVSTVELLKDLKIDHWYYAYMKRWGTNPKEFRAMAFTDGTIFIHNNNESLDSLSWVLVHELGHEFCATIEKQFGYGLFEELSGGPLSNMSKEEYNIYLTNDDVHEARYEEQFVNNIANKMISGSYDRHWWRKHCYVKEGNQNE